MSANLMLSDLRRNSWKDSNILMPVRDRRIYGPVFVFRESVTIKNDSYEILGKHFVACTRRSDRLLVLFCGRAVVLFNYHRNTFRHTAYQDGTFRPLAIRKRSPV